jgi:hypothetical protein
MADDGKSVNRPECEEQIDTVNSTEENVSETPGSGENDVSIEIIHSILVSVALSCIMYLKSSF